MLHLKKGRTIEQEGREGGWEGGDISVINSLAH